MNESKPKLTGLIKPVHVPTMLRRLATALESETVLRRLQQEWPDRATAICRSAVECLQAAGIDPFDGGK